MVHKTKIQMQNNKNSNLLLTYADMMRDDNIPNVSPCQLDRNFAGDFCEDEICYRCRKKFWNHKLDERDSFMNF